MKPICFTLLPSPSCAKVARNGSLKSLSTCSMSHCLCSKVLLGRTDCAPYHFLVGTTNM